VSLAALVHYAQHGSEQPESSPFDESDDESSVVEPQRDSRRREDVPVPDWLRRRDPNSVVEKSDGHEWQIHTDVKPLPIPKVEEVGPDALGFYIPFHYYREGWGIYIRESGVKHLACALKGGALKKGDEHLLSVAELVIQDHELWHSATEIACTRAEMLARRSLYRTYLRSPDARLHEEALANAHAFWRAERQLRPESSNVCARG
jgi:hypothetical protein